MCRQLNNLYEQASYRIRTELETGRYAAVPLAEISDSTVPVAGFVICFWTALPGGRLAGCGALRDEKLYTISKSRNRQEGLL